MLDPNMIVKMVAHAIPASPAPPRSAASIGHDLGLSRHQIDRAVATLRDDHPDLPLTSSGAGYLWSRDETDVKRHAHKEVRYLSTRTRRSLLDGLLAPYQEHCAPELLSRTRQRIEFIIDDLSKISA